MERAAKSQPRGSVGLTPEQLKTQQQKMRRASIAMGVLSAAATVQRVSKEMIDTAVSTSQAPPTSSTPPIVCIAKELTLNAIAMRLSLPYA